MQVIARLDGLQVLNATPVTVHERKDSELQYVRSVLGEHSTACSDLLVPWVPEVHHNTAHLMAVPSRDHDLAAPVELLLDRLWRLHCLIAFSDTFAMHIRQNKLHISCLQVSWAVCQAARQRPLGASTHACSSSRTGL